MRNSTSGSHPSPQASAKLKPWTMPTSRRQQNLTMCVSTKGNDSTLANTLALEHSLRPYLRLTFSSHPNSANSVACPPKAWRWATSRLALRRTACFHANGLARATRLRTVKVFIASIELAFDANFFYPMQSEFVSQPRGVTLFCMDGVMFAVLAKSFRVAASNIAAALLAVRFLRC